MNCINLKHLFGDRYKVQYEESYYAEYGPNATVTDPWLMIIPCQNGEICPWGDSTLAACTATPGPVASKLKRLPFTEIAQDGDDGANVLFDVGYFDAVAKIMKPRKRRPQMSEAEKRAVGERLRPYQPSPGQSVRDVVRQRSQNGPEPPPTATAV